MSILFKFENVDGGESVTDVTTIHVMYPACNSMGFWNKETNVYDAMQLGGGDDYFKQVQALIDSLGLTYSVDKTIKSFEEV